jgi:hypothetical protein
MKTGRSKREHRAFAYAAAVAVLFAAVPPDAGATQKFGPLELSGNVQSQQLVRHPDVDQFEFIQQRNTMHIRVDWKWKDKRGKWLDRFEMPWVENSTFFLLYRGAYDSVYDTLPSIKTERDFQGVKTDPRFDNIDDLDRDERDGAKFENVLRELYVDVQFKMPLTLRLGRQQIIWGESDGFRMLDRVNSLDLTWHQFQELPGLNFGFDELRRPFWMAKGIYDFGEVATFSNVFAEAYWNPGDWEPNKIRFLPHPWGVKIANPLTNPRDGAYFFPERADRLMNGTSLFKQGNYDRNPIDNSQFGIRFNVVAGNDTPLLPAGLQIQAGYLYQRFTQTGGISTSAAPARGIKPNAAGMIETARLRTNGTVPVEFYAPYIHTIGLASNYFDEWSSTVYRLESAYDFGLPFFSCGPKPEAIAAQDRCVRESTFAPFLPGIRNHDVWSGLLAFDRPTGMRLINKRSTFFVTGQFFWNYLIQKANSTIGALDLPTITRPLNQDPAIAYRDDIRRWEMLMTLAIIGFYKGGSVIPAFLYILDPINDYSQEVAWGVDYYLTPNFAVNLAQRYIINPKRQLNFEPWGLGGLNRGRSETGLRFTYQF